jgi:DNA-binding CsgD family transcriptional regulator
VVARRVTSGQALALLCRIVLAWAEGTSNAEVAAGLGISRSTVNQVAVAVCHPPPGEPG